ncbi:HesA/MoeB/ThiF family protein [Alistipes sp.]|uniref:HesA/MoeB/ThiF family protein n=1 Tax=Alistipes sp. TaxID=1872444 RepID=UPI0025C0C6C3|nr:HesA/MoeB/ThiF family protein [Alistipes sp.]MCI7140555.1 HesA/MoeB/ThiF family protein [Alistipes sp.]MDY5397307.1 HesA/MoeB/ThiF family protein [Alistipes sp.]
MNPETRYARQILLPEIGLEGQQQLLRSAVLLVGLGGLGSAVAPALVGAGVGRIGLADPDTVSESNLQRQTLYTERQIGQPKCEAARQRLAALSSHTLFDLHAKGITPENARRIIADYDLVIDCCDNFPTRYLLDDACAACGKPWVHGAIGAFGGMVTVFNHRRAKRYAELYPDREALCAREHAVQGVVGTVPAVVGALEASEALKLLAGFGDVLDGRLFTIDLKTMHTELMDF